MKALHATRVCRFARLKDAKLDANFVNIAFYDERLLRTVPGLRGWLKFFDLAIDLRAGEELKAASRIDPVIEKLVAAPLGYSRSRTRFFAIGGGSVGDFVGFLASVFLRGVEFVQVPTTWLSAMDSAHGGKTALNAAGVKNVLGTFHPATEAWLIQEFFRDQGGERLQEALGEAAKMALLDREIWDEVGGRVDDVGSRGTASRRQRMVRRGQSWSPKRMEALLPQIIAAKLRVVRKDPYETRGPRRYLNLGHTLGHALEAYHGMPHGIAVGIGIYFSIWVSWCEGLLRSEAFFEIERKLALNWGISLEGLASLKIPRDEVARLFLRDKKAIASGEVCFIALRGVGRPVPLVLRVDDLLEHLEGFWG